MYNISIEMSLYRKLLVLSKKERRTVRSQGTIILEKAVEGIPDPGVMDIEKVKELGKKLTVADQARAAGLSKDDVIDLTEAVSDFLGVPIEPIK